MPPFGSDDCVDEGENNNGEFSPGALGTLANQSDTFNLVISYLDARSWLSVRAVSKQWRSASNSVTYLSWNSEEPTLPVLGDRLTNLRHLTMSPLRLPKRGSYPVIMENLQFLRIVDHTNGVQHGYIRAPSVSHFSCCGHFSSSFLLKSLREMTKIKHLEVHDASGSVDWKRFSEIASSLHYLEELVLVTKHNATPACDDVLKVWFPRLRNLTISSDFFIPSKVPDTLQQFSLVKSKVLATSAQTHTRVVFDVGIRQQEECKLSYQTTLDFAAMIGLNELSVTLQQFKERDQACHAFDVLLTAFGSPSKDLFELLINHSWSNDHIDALLEAWPLTAHQEHLLMYCMSHTQCLSRPLREEDIRAGKREIKPWKFIELIKLLTSPRAGRSERGIRRIAQLVVPFGQSRAVEILPAFSDKMIMSFLPIWLFQSARFDIPTVFKWVLQIGRSKFPKILKEALDSTQFEGYTVAMHFIRNVHSPTHTVPGSRVALTSMFHKPTTNIFENINIGLAALKVSGAEFNTKVTGPRNNILIALAARMLNEKGTDFAGLSFESVKKSFWSCVDIAISCGSQLDACAAASLLHVATFLNNGEMIEKMVNLTNKDAIKTTTLTIGAYINSLCSIHLESKSRQYSRKTQAEFQFDKLCAVGIELIFEPDHLEEALTALGTGRSYVAALDLLLRKSQAVPKSGSLLSRALICAITERNYPFAEALISRNTEVTAEVLQSFIRSSRDILAEDFSCQEAENLRESVLSAVSREVLNAPLASNGMFPLVLALEQGHMSLFEALLNHGAQLDITSADGGSILHMIGARSAKTVSALLTASDAGKWGRINVNQLNKSRKHALTRWVHTWIPAKALRNPPSALALIAGTSTPLHWSPELLKQIIVEEDLLKALESYITNHKSSCADLLLGVCAWASELVVVDVIALMATLRKQDPEICSVRQLSKNAVNMHGLAPIHLLCQRGFISAIYPLIELMGPSILIQPAHVSLKTPLMFAVGCSGSATTVSSDRHEGNLMSREDEPSCTLIKAAKSLRSYGIPDLEYKRTDALGHTAFDYVSNYLEEAALADCLANKESLCASELFELQTVLGSNYSRVHRVLSSSKKYNPSSGCCSPDVVLSSSSSGSLLSSTSSSADAKSSFDFITVPFPPVHEPRNTFQSPPTSPLINSNRRTRRASSGAKSPKPAALSQPITPFKPVESPATGPNGTSGAEPLAPPGRIFFSANTTPDKQATPSSSSERATSSLSPRPPRFIAVPVAVLHEHNGVNDLPNKRKRKSVHRRKSASGASFPPRPLQDLEEDFGSPLRRTTEITPPRQPRNLLTLGFDEIVGLISAATLRADDENNSERRSGSDTWNEPRSNEPNPH